MLEAPQADESGENGNTTASQETRMSIAFQVAKAQM